ncbi:MAG: Zn-ribbon domain-containing OB-fold protein [Desulfobacteraceae bacterium]|nr:MAG: Zn-ribbon domain-containing OB-fold protein [Desulfobacteraceae bacterium]
MGNKHQIPVRENLWRDTSSGPRLMGSKCLVCGELYFPRKDNGVCTNCQARELEEVEFSTRGKVYSCTCVMQRPPVYYKGEVPYAIGFVELPEGIRIETLFTDCDIEDVHVGMPVEMVLSKLHEDESGNDVIAYKFRPTD